MKTIVFLILALVILLALRWPSIDWLSWFDGVAFGAAGIVLYMQLLRRYCRGKR